MRKPGGVVVALLLKETLKDPPARIFVNDPAWNGGFDIEADCIAAVLDVERAFHP